MDNSYQPRPDKSDRLQPYHGFIVYTIVFVYIFFISGFVNAYLGYKGIIYSQLMFFALPVVTALILRADLRKAIPMNSAPMRKIAGTIPFYIGIYCLNLTISYFMITFFPAIQDTVQDISYLKVIMPNPAVAVLIIAMLPAICEEILMRGFILATFSKLRTSAAIIIVGVMFGILHTDVFRFFPTAIMGMASAYVVIQTKSLAFPIIFHFVNNLSSVLSLYTYDSAKIPEQINRLTSNVIFSVSAMLIYFAVSLFFTAIGLAMLSDKKIYKIIRTASIILSILLVVTGITLITINFPL